jgi:hypothetical protein
MLGYEYKGTISDAKIEERAREMGMHYESECKVIFGRDENK